MVQNMSASCLLYRSYKRNFYKTFEFDGSLSPELCPVVVCDDSDDVLSDILPKRINLVSSTKSMFLGIRSFFNPGLLMKELLIVLTE